MALPRAQWFEGMVEGNVRELGWAIEGEEVLRPALEREVVEVLAALDADAANPLGEHYALSSADLAREIRGAEKVLLDGGHLAVYEATPDTLAWLTERPAR